MKCLALIALLLLTSALHAQTPGVGCVPIQGQGWQGCAPINNSSHPQLRWVSQWGAIATDVSAGKLGASTNKTNQSTAEEAAIEDCHAKGGNNCLIEIAYHDQCAVMILGDKKYNVGSAASIAIASKIGIKQCSSASTNCRVFYSACSLPVQAQ